MCLQAQNLQLPVIKAVKQTEHECILRAGTPQPGNVVCCNNFYRTYDIKGNILQEQKYDMEGKVDEKEDFVYDARGNEISDILYLADGSVDYKILSKYNNRNLVTEKRTYDGEGGLICTEKFTYDGFGNVLRIIETDEKGKVTKRVARSYNERGDIVQDYCMYVGKNGFGWKEVYQYNEHGKLMVFQGYSDCDFSPEGEILHHQTTQGDMLLHKYNLQYDMQSHLLQVNLLNDKNELQRVWKYIYQNNVLVKKEMYDAHGVLLRMWQYSTTKEGHSVIVSDGKNKKLQQQTDNSQGLLTELYSNENGEISHTSYTYTYDKYGNWVSMVIYDHTLKAYTLYVEREITYE